MGSTVGHIAMAYMMAKQESLSADDELDPKDHGHPMAAQAAPGWQVSLSAEAHSMHGALPRSSSWLYGSACVGTGITCHLQPPMIGVAYGQYTSIMQAPESSVGSSQQHVTLHGILDKPGSYWVYQARARNLPMYRITHSVRLLTPPHSSLHAHTQHSLRSTAPPPTSPNTPAMLCISACPPLIHAHPRIQAHNKLCTRPASAASPAACGITCRCRTC